MNSEGQVKGRLCHVIQIAVNVTLNLSNVCLFTNLSTQDFTHLLYVSLGLFRCRGKR